jgi:hypothetical protein
MALADGVLGTQRVEALNGHCVAVVECDASYAVRLVAKQCLLVPEAIGSRPLACQRAVWGSLYEISVPVAHSLETNVAAYMSRRLKSAFSRNGTLSGEKCIQPCPDAILNASGVPLTSLNQYPVGCFRYSNASLMHLPHALL